MSNIKFSMLSRNFVFDAEDKNSFDMGFRGLKDHPQFFVCKSEVFLARLASSLLEPRSWQSFVVTTVTTVTITNFHEFNKKPLNSKLLQHKIFQNLKQPKAFSLCIVQHLYQHCLALALLRISIAQHCLTFHSISIAQHQHCLTLGI